jgi:hypothetical protein
MEAACDHDQLVQRQWHTVGAKYLWRQEERQSMALSLPKDVVRQQLRHRSHQILHLLRAKPVSEQLLFSLA